MPRTRRTPFVSRVLHDWNCPPAVPARCSVAMRKDALRSLSIHVFLSFTAPLRSVLFRLSSVAFRLTTSISLHCVLFHCIAFHFGYRLCGVCYVAVPITKSAPLQAHSSRFEPAVPLHSIPRHSIALHSSRQPPLHLSASTSLHSISLMIPPATH